MSSTMKPRPASIAGHEWGWLSHCATWVLLELDTTRWVGTEGSPEVAEVIRKIEEAASLERFEEAHNAAIDRRREAEATKNDNAPMIEESVMVDDMPAIEHAEPEVRNCTTNALPVHPAGTLIQILEDQPRPLDVMVETTINYEAWSMSLKTELDATKHQLADQERETARLSANLEALEREMEETKAANACCTHAELEAAQANVETSSRKVGVLVAQLESTKRELQAATGNLEKERAIHRDTTYQLQGAHRARATFKAQHADEMWQARAWMLVLLLAFFAAMWYQSYTDADLHSCRTNFAALQDVGRSTRAFFGPLKDATESLIKLRNSVASVMVNLDILERAPGLKP